MEIYIDGKLVDTSAKEVKIITDVEIEITVNNKGVTFVSDYIEEEIDYETLEM